MEELIARRREAKRESRKGTPVGLQRVQDSFLSMKSALVALHVGTAIARRQSGLVLHANVARPHRVCDQAGRAEALGDETPQEAARLGGGEFLRCCDDQRREDVGVGEHVPRAPCVAGHWPERSQRKDVARRGEQRDRVSRGGSIDDDDGPSHRGVGKIGDGGQAYEVAQSWRHRGHRRKGSAVLKAIGQKAKAQRTQQKVAKSLIVIEDDLAAGSTMLFSIFRCGGAFSGRKFGAAGAVNAICARARRGPRHAHKKDAVAALGRGRGERFGDGRFADSALAGHEKDARCHGASVWYGVVRSADPGNAAQRRVRRCKTKRSPP